MGPIEKAIHEFIQKRLDVYRADPQQIVRDTRAAERATGDHTGRWLFELLQNSDDAGATEVLVLVEDDTVYVADNGRGLKPEAVSAICGTDFSDKTAGTIGRKGVGFKSVYEVSRNPQVLTVDGEGIEFNPDRTTAWLQENNLDDGHVPYQWIPFLIPWDHVQRQDQQLGALTAYKTVVRLPGLSQEKKQKVEQLLREWPPHALFAFRHLRQIKAPGLEVVLSAGDGVWSLRDSRGETPVEWQVSRHAEHPPADLLEGLGADERQALSEDGVGFLIAAPLENDCVVPTTDYLPVHVFYPTEQKGPVRLLLHAEFLVKSDRTALIPIADNPFNAWVADRLAYHVCKFVNDSYRPESPSRHASLLVPFGDRASHPVAKDLWQRIAERAKTELRLPDIEGRQHLTVGQARLLSVSVRADLARTLLEATSVREQLLHSAFDDDKEAQKALTELGCEQIYDQDLMDVIAENAGALAADSQWIWACWEWLAAWVDKKPYGEEHKKRIERAKALPIVPIDGSLVKASDLARCIVTWKSDATVHVGDLPDWLPLTFVDDWFRDRIQAVADQEPSVKELCKELGITEPGADVIQRAVGRAVKQYWKDKQGDPARFLRFILKQDWYETSEASSALQQCPVPLAQPVKGERWAEAGKAYFGREWGNDLLAELYDGVETVAWVANDDTNRDNEKLRQALEWLGVANCPRIVEEEHNIKVRQLPDDCSEWKQYLKTARDYCGRRVEQIASVGRIDHLFVASLDETRAPFLIRLIAQHWGTYYADRTKVTAKGTQGREQYYRPWKVKAKWWWEVCEVLFLPRRDGGTKHIALTGLWLPDKRTKRAIGGLLPVVDLEAFGDDKDIVRDWLIDAVGLRTRMEQLDVEEWKELLSTRIPQKAPVKRLVSDERLRDDVTRWYAACLETVAEQENVPQKAFASCPLLCQKADSWKYVAEEPRYLVDDDALKTAFAGDVWLFHVPPRLAQEAAKYLGVLPLSKSVQVDVTPGEPKSSLSGELQRRFDASLPYVWVWRSSQSKQDAEKLPAFLKKLRVFVVPVLKARLELDGVQREVPRPWHVKDDTIYLHSDHANEAELAEALAQAVGRRSEAEFYENLLRCNDDDQRKKKLSNKGIVVAEVERCLRKYSQDLDAEEQEQEEDSNKPTKSKGDEGSDVSKPHSLHGNETQQKELVAGEQQGEASEKSQERADEDKQPLRLKDASTVEYVLGGAPEVGGGHGGGGDGEETGQGGRLLTEEEKTKLEEAGRRVAARELEKMGFSVEVMPLDYPGFDLRAKRNGEELRVEVKAHTGRATVVDVTQRQYKEYLYPQGYRWELWNVEHLAEDDAEPVTITRYDDIPVDALRARTFRVDLKKCKSPANPSAAPE